MEKFNSIEEIYKAINKCKKCNLYTSRIVPCKYRGSLSAKIMIIGEAFGRTEQEAGLPFCLWEGHKVLMADFTWKVLGDIKVGDNILTIDENSNDVDYGVTKKAPRKWQIATVNSVRKSKKEALRVITKTGDLIATPDHRVLTAYKNPPKNINWMEVRKLVCGEKYKSCIAYAFAPWREKKNFSSGYISGFFDGEGWVSKNTKKFLLGYTQRQGEVSNYIKNILKENNYILGKDGISEYKGNITERIRINGGLPEIFRFLGEFQPKRLINNLVERIEKLEHPLHLRNFRDKDILGEVIYKEKCGSTDVVDISTTAGTFIADGFVVHNCGRAGQLLDRLLMDVGLDIDKDIYFTNVVHDRPPNNRDPFIDEIKSCQSYIINEIKLINPKLIITLGRVPGNWWNRYRPFNIYQYYPERKWLPLYHTAYLLRQPKTAQFIWKKALIKVLNIL